MLKGDTDTDTDTLISEISIPIPILILFKYRISILIRYQYDTFGQKYRNFDTDTMLVVNCICFLAVVRNIHCLFYMGPVGHSKSNLETRIPDFY